MIIKIKQHKILIDDNKVELIKDRHLTICKSRNNYFPQIWISNKKRVALVKYLFPEFVNYKLFYIDKNTKNIKFENIIARHHNKQEYRKEYYKKNRKEIIKKSVEWVYANLDRHYKTCTRTRARAEKSGKSKMKRQKNLNRRYGILCKNAKNREISINLSLEEYKSLIENGFCYYCNKDLSLEQGGSLDRIINSKGYHITNVLPCCGTCNKMRGDRYTMEETKVMISALLEYRKNIKKNDESDLLIMPEKKVVE